MGAETSIKRDLFHFEQGIEAAAQVAERDVDWTTFAKQGLEPWEGGADALRDYRLGIAVGRAIAAAIRREKQ